MKKLVYILAAVIISTGILSSCKKGNQAYVCNCYDPARGLADTLFTISVETSGEATWVCKNFADTANKYGRPYVCKITE